MNENLIVLTGYSERELNGKKLNKNVKHCYRCKRTSEDRTAVIFGGEVMFQDMKEFYPVTMLIDNDNNPVLFKFWFCAECHLLKEHEHDKVVETFPMELFERDDI